MNRETQVVVLLLALYSNFTYSSGDVLSNSADIDVQENGQFKKPVFFHLSSFIEKQHLQNSSGSFFLKGVNLHNETLTENDSKPPSNEARCIVKVRDSDRDDLRSKLAKYPTCELKVSGVFAIDFPIFLNTKLTGVGEVDTKETFVSFPTNKGTSGTVSEQYPLILDKHSEPRISRPGAIFVIAQQVSDDFMLLRSQGVIENIGFSNEYGAVHHSGCFLTGINQLEGGGIMSSVFWPSTQADVLCSNWHEGTSESHPSLPLQDTLSDFNTPEPKQASGRGSSVRQRPAAATQKRTMKEKLKEKTPTEGETEEEIMVPSSAAGASAGDEDDEKDKKKKKDEKLIAEKKKLLEAFIAYKNSFRDATEKQKKEGRKIHAETAPKLTAAWEGASRECQILFTSSTYSGAKRALGLKTKPRLSVK